MTAAKSSEAVGLAKLQRGQAPGPGPFCNWPGARPIEDKLSKLRETLRSSERVLVAFSGGADSAFVLKVARDVLGKENVLAVIAKSPSLPASELEEARAVASEIDAPLAEIETHELDNPNYTANSVNRCYFCKTELYSHLAPIARELGFSAIVNGTNQDDLGDWRPGLKAASENQIKSPLVEAGFTKREIREVSQKLGLSTWSKPQAACLSSRIPFGTDVTPERLEQVEQGEALLKNLGFEVVRLRWFGKNAQIEVGLEETGIFFQGAEIREKVFAQLKDLGFETIELNLQGYRTGRFNPTSKGVRPLLGV